MNYHMHIRNMYRHVRTSPIVMKPMKALMFVLMDIPLGAGAPASMMALKRVAGFRESGSELVGS